MDNNITIEILLVGIPFILIAISLGLNRTIKNEKIILDSKWNSLDNLIIRKSNLIKEFLSLNKKNFQNDKQLIEASINLEKEFIKSSSIKKTIKLNDSLNTIIEEIELIVSKNSTIINSKQYQKYDKELKEINSSLDYASNFYNDNVTKYNEMLNTFPYNIITLIFGYKAYQKFNIKK